MRIFYLRLLVVTGLTLLVSTAAAQKTWTPMGQPIEGRSKGNRGDCSVSLSADGKRVAIGTYSKGSFNADSKGHTEIYQFSGKEWCQLGEDIRGVSVGDQSGAAISLCADGSRIAIGARLHGGKGSIAGHTRIFEYSKKSWVQVGNEILGETVNDQSGYSVSLSADGLRVAIGAYYNSDNGDNSGHVRIFENRGAAWIQVGGDIDGEAVGDQSGYSVALSADGRRVAIGAIFNSGAGHQAGHTRVYEYAAGSWVQLGADLDGEAADDWSGCAVSLNADGSRIAIGAFTNDGNGSMSGHTRIFNYIGNHWVQMGWDIDGEAPGDQSGRAVSLSADGNRVAIASCGNDENGSDSGYTRIFEYAGNNWVQVGENLVGESVGEFSGWAVSLSADGTRVAVGSLYNDSGRKAVGRLRVWSSKKIIDVRGIVLKILSWIGLVVSIALAGLVIQLIIKYLKKRRARYLEESHELKERSDTARARYFQGYGFDEIGITVWPSKKYKYLYENLERVHTRVTVKNGRGSYTLHLDFSGKRRIAVGFASWKKLDAFAAVLKEILNAAPETAILDSRTGFISKWENYKGTYEDLKNRVDHGFQLPSLDLVKAYWIRLEHKKALKVLNAFLKQTPDHREALMMQAEITAESGGKQKNIDASLEKALESDPESAGTLEILALRSIKKKKFDEAEMYIDRLQNAAPEAPALYNALGCYLFAKKQLPEACQAFKRAADLATDDQEKKQRRAIHEHYKNYKDDKIYRVRYVFLTKVIPWAFICFVYGVILFQVLRIIIAIILKITGSR